ncbi:hypothetical protein ACFPOI_17055 [Nonomuraea angiospora]|uniref:Transposase IS4-like domain-containing protein n=1 Tax=Nonomuraea angiospora TaxID=46172 RepID=A0ABR9MHF3_9ACTN|nr:hypothetical protein [Nonomuraea angiospora]MBE1592352.1 hypothetical protein [Nonomuraea angiospora]
MHITETCHRSADAHDGADGTGTTGPDTGLGTNLGTRPPNLITNVATTDATVPDTAMTETIHQHLARRGLLPAEHYLDAGYSSAELVVAAREQHQMTVVTPLRPDNSLQARTETATTAPPSPSTGNVGRSPARKDRPAPPGHPADKKTAR